MDSSSNSGQPLIGTGLNAAIESLNQPEERMLKWFAFEHLPAHLKDTSRMFHSLAVDICKDIAPGPERTVALRKLLESKDAAVRAKLNPGG